MIIKQKKQPIVICRAHETNKGFLKLFQFKRGWVLGSRRKEQSLSILNATCCNHSAIGKTIWTDILDIRWYIHPKQNISWYPKFNVGYGFTYPKWILIGYGYQYRISDIRFFLVSFEHLIFDQWRISITNNNLLYKKTHLIISLTIYKKKNYNPISFIESNCRNNHVIWKLEISNHTGQINSCMYVRMYL